jgi:hypothetical protein
MKCDFKNITDNNRILSIRIFAIHILVEPVSLDNNDTCQDNLQYAHQE